METFDRHATVVPWCNLRCGRFCSTRTSRRWGQSTGVLYDGSGNSFVGLLRLAFSVGARWARGMRYMGMIHRVEQVMTRAEDYDFLLALCRNEIPRSKAEDLLVQ